MYCPNCGKILDDNSVICDGCGEHFAIEEQKGRVLASRAKTKTIIANLFRSKLFLVISIIICVMCLGALISSFSPSFNLMYVLILAFAIVSVVAAWTLFAGKKSNTADGVKNLRSFPKVMKIVYTISYIFLIVIIVVLLILAAMFGSLMDTLAEEGISISEAFDEGMNVAYEQGFIDDESMILVEDAFSMLEESFGITKADFFDIIPLILVILAVILTFSVALTIIYSIAMKKTEKYLAVIEETLRNGEYKEASSPGQFLFVIGIICAVSGGTSFITLGTGSSLFPLAAGAYLIVMGMFFKKTHAELTENNSLIAYEQSRLAQVAQLTNQAIADMAAAKAAEAEAPEAEEIDNSPIEETTEYAPIDETSSEE